MTTSTRGRRQRVSAYGLAIWDGAILLAKIAPGYPSAGRWTLPGGGIDWGEDPVDAVHRELYEETGLAGEVQTLLGIDSLSLSRRQGDRVSEYHGLRIIYRLRIRGGEPMVTEVNGSTSEAAWISLDDTETIPVAELVTKGLEMLRGWNVLPLRP